MNTRLIKNCSGLSTVICFCNFFPRRLKLISAVFFMFLLLSQLPYERIVSVRERQLHQDTDVNQFYLMKERQYADRRRRINEYCQTQSRNFSRQGIQNISCSITLLFCDFLRFYNLICSIVECKLRSPYLRRRGWRVCVHHCKGCEFHLARPFLTHKK